MAGSLAGFFDVQKIYLLKAGFSTLYQTDS